MTEEKIKPVTGKIGNVRYKVWENKREQGETRYSVEIYRLFQQKKQGDSEPQWRESHSFSEDDLKLIPLVLAEVTEHLAAKRNQAA